MSPKRAKILDDIVGRRILVSSDVRWGTNAKPAFSVFNERKGLNRVFEKLMESNDDKTIRQAGGYKNQGCGSGHILMETEARKIDLCRFRIIQKSIL